MSERSSFESEFQDSPQPMPSYQDGYSGPQPVMDMGNRPAQKGVSSEAQRTDAAIVNARLTLAGLSLVMILALFIITLGIASSAPLYSPFLWLAIFFSLIFTGAALIINIVFLRRS